jgi:glycosyltransferase involved in cell wall biosynthesis
MTTLKRAAMLLAFKRARRIVGVSEGISTSIVSSGIATDKVCTIPAFLPPSIDSFQTGKASYKANQSPVKLCASGYGTSLYGWHVLLAAFRELPEECRLHLAFYNSYDEPYFQALLALISGDPRILITRDLSPEEFASLLRESDVFIRPTETDGDSIAVRESLYLGLKVVASDAVSRPTGCVLFRTGDSSDLANKLLQELKNLSLTARSASPSERNRETIDQVRQTIGIYQFA